MPLPKITTLLIVSLLTLAACSSNNETYSHNEVNRIQTSLTGTIEQIEVVNVDGYTTWIGPTTGSIVGGILGSTVGNGWGRIIASITGSALGSVAGGGTEKQIRKGEGLKLTIQRSDGLKFTTVIVPEDNQTFKVGDRVNIVTSSSGAIQVTHQ